MKIPQRKLYSTEHIELLSTIGQGIHTVKTIIIYKTLTIMYTGESGLVYKAYVKKEDQTDLVAVKTGKGEEIH